MIKYSAQNIEKLKFIKDSETQALQMETHKSIGNKEDQEKNTLQFNSVGLG